MNQRPAFHGSDLEKIEAYYHIPKEEIVGFGANVNPLGLSEHVRQEISEHLDVITTYPDREYRALRRTIGAYCHVSQSHIVVGNGSTELISMLIQNRRPKKALLLGPTYSEYEREISLCGGKMEYYNLSAEQNFKLDLEKFCACLTPSVELLILCNPNNPTSSALTTDELEIILKTCQKSDIFVMIDETYVEFAPSVEAVTAMPLAEHYENLMILRGVSKFFAAPGLRLGYGVTSNEAFLSVIRTHQNPWSLNSIGAFAGEIMLKDKEYIEATRQLICTERTRMYESLKKIKGFQVFEPSANFLLVRVTKTGLTSFDIFDRLIRQKMMIRDCSSFQSLGETFFRFCIMMPEDNTRLLHALENIAAES